MKGIILEEMVVDSALDFSHDNFHPIRRLVIPERGNLTITYSNGNCFVFHMDSIDGRYTESIAGRKWEAKVIKEVDVSETFIQCAELLLESNKQMQDLEEEYSEMVG